MSDTVEVTVTVPPADVVSVTVRPDIETITIETQGVQGVTGISAYQGAVLQGYVGTEAQWLASLKGDKGDKGDTGETGATGLKGDTGATGAQGVQGIKGDTGSQGIQGIQGIQGVPGEKGDKGDAGTSVGGTPVYVQATEPTDANCVWFDTHGGNLTLWIKTL